MTNRIMLGAAFLFLSLATGFAQGVGDNEEAQARMQKGVSLYQQGQYAAALAEMEPVAAGFPNYAAAYRLVGLCQLQLKRYEKAAETLRRANQLSQEQEKRDDPAARIGLGRALLYAEKWAEALPELEYAVSQNKSDAAAQYSLAVARYKLGDEAGATSSLTQATTLNERNADAPEPARSDASTSPHSSFPRPFPNLSAPSPRGRPTAPCISTSVSPSRAPNSWPEPRPCWKKPPNCCPTTPTFCVNWDTSTNAPTSRRRLSPFMKKPTR